MFKKLLSLLLILGLAICPAYAADNWDKSVPAGSDSPSTIDTSVQANNGAIDRLLAHYRRGCDIYWISSSSLGVSAGEVTCSNAAGSVRRMRQNTTATTVTWSDLDTGAEASSTVYSIYAVADVTDSATFTVVISVSSSAPSGSTYYRKLGEMYNSSAGDFELTGIIKMFCGPVSTIPASMLICDGSNGTPDLSDHFILGAGNLADPGDSKSSSYFSLAGTGSAITYAAAAGGGGLGSGDSRLVYSTYDHIPPYYALAFVMERGVE